MLKFRLNMRNVLATAIFLCSFSFFAGIAFSSCTNLRSNPAEPQPTAELTFSLLRQTGSGSNQFAVWVENSEGSYVTTLFATNFTASGGWQRRATSLPLWVKQSGISEMDAAQTDAFTGATPDSGSLTYRWDGTDSRGVAIPAGNYVLFLEGTLRGENQVVYRAPIQIGRGTVEAQVNVEYIGTPPGSEREMISNVSVRVLR